MTETAAPLLIGPPATTDDVLALLTTDVEDAPTDETPTASLLPSLDKPPLDPRVLRTILVRYDGATVHVPQCDSPVYHGHGVAVFRTGFTYTGAFHFGRMHGHGRIEWTSGVTYDGTFVDNEMIGHGTYTWPNGSSYVGDVVRGRRHGNGVFHTGTRGAVTVTSGDATALGADTLTDAMDAVSPLQFSFHGSEHADMLEASSNARYEGQWVDGLPHGRGTLVFDDDQHVRYEGEFVQGKRHGHGEMRYASGNLYVGQWAHDVKCGHGTMLWMGASSSGGAIEKYDGAWRDDRPHGHGRHVWLGAARPHQREKNWYEGQFAHGVRHGLGAFFYANGARYEGEWVDNAKHGTGIFFYEDGRVFLGEFRDDRAVESVSAGGDLAAPTNSGKILLFVDDLLPSDARDKARKLLEHAVLRLNTELRALYRQYISLPAPGSPTRPSVHSPVKALDDASPAEAGAVLMEFYECRRLLADCGLKLSAGHLERHVQHVRDAQRATATRADAAALVPDVQLTNAVTLAASLPEVVPPTRLLLYREFVELLVRLAHEQQQHRQLVDEAPVTATAAKPAHALADAFVSLYDQLTRQRQQRQAVMKATTVSAADAWIATLEQLHAKELHAVYQKHHHAFQRLFVACDDRTRGVRWNKIEEAEPHENEGEDDRAAPAPGPETVAVRSLLAQLQDLHVFSSSFRVRDALVALQQAFTIDDDDRDTDTDAPRSTSIDPFFVTTPLLFTDFLDAVAIVLLTKQRQRQKDHQHQQEEELSTVTLPMGTPLYALVDDFLHSLPAQL